MAEPQFPQHPFLLSAEETARVLETDIDKGLTSAQVAELQQKYPKNELQVGGIIPWHKLLAKQVLNAMIIVLAFAMALSFGISDYIEGGVLAAVIFLNVTVGFWQEYRAEKRMDALRALSSPSAMVLRDGKTIVIANPEVVPGDVVLLKMGDTVPADMRLFEAMNLACEEGQLTGESLAVEKAMDAGIMVPGTEKQATSANEVGIGDRVNMCYATTVVRKGRGRGIVTATGMTTEVGKIAASTTKKQRKAGRSMNWRKYGKRQPVVGLARRTYDVVGKFLGLTEGTPLQRKLSALAYVLFGCAIVLAMVVFAVNRFDLSNEVIIYATSLGIAIIPESLVAVLTLTMVVAVTVMRKANVVVRDLSALEALGGVTNICSDKTGTLTEGAMIVRQAWIPESHLYTVHDSQSPSDPTKGRVTYSREGKADDNKEDKAVARDYDRERSGAAIKFDVPDAPPVPRPTAPEPQPTAEVTDGLRAFLLSAALCNLATVRYDDDDERWQTTGEPTEVALQVFAHRFRMGKKALEAQGWRQRAEFPFDSAIKRMSVVYDAPATAEAAAAAAGAGEDNGAATGGGIVEPGRSLVLVKGAAERVLDLCTHVGAGAERLEATPARRDAVLQQMSALASQGQRVLAVAYRTWTGRWGEDEEDLDDDDDDDDNDDDDEGEKHEAKKPRPRPRPAKGARAGGASDSDQRRRAAVERGLTLLGLAGIYDPPRRETKAAIGECARAGIRVHMLTGDHAETAKAIAKEVGIIPRDAGRVLPAAVAAALVQRATDFDAMSDAALDALPELPLVLARCAPDTKTRMIEALRRRGALMAMTGDGVNDAPSLSRADVGIAMGSGSDVAKSAAKMVLADDKFNSIVAAIREGRRMFDNIQKFVLHLVTSNVGEVLLLVAGLAFVDAAGYSVFPVSPLQVIWINMLTSSFPAFGLGRERAAPDVMRKPPHDGRRGVFTNQVLADMAVCGVAMGACALCTFAIVVYGAHGGRLGADCNASWSEACVPVFRARAATFAELTWLILVSAWEFKSLRRSLFRLYPDDDGDASAAAARWPLFRDLYGNRFLFWSVVVGALSVFPVVYIPFLNTRFFKHQAISWEWALAVAFTLVFVAVIELWKLCKRSLGLFEDRPVEPGPWGQGGGGGGGGEDQGGAGPRFRKTLSVSSFKTWASFSRKDTADSAARAPLPPRTGASAV